MQHVGEVIEQTQNNEATFSTTKVMEKKLIFFTNWLFISLTKSFNPFPGTIFWSHLLDFLRVCGEDVRSHTFFLIRIMNHNLHILNVFKH